MSFGIEVVNNKGSLVWDDNNYPFEMLDIIELTTYGSGSQVFSGHSGSLWVRGLKLGTQYYPNQMLKSSELWIVGDTVHWNISSGSWGSSDAAEIQVFRV